jgi:homoserine trans-succinylase
MKNKQVLAALAATGIAVFAIKKFISADEKQAKETPKHHLTNAFSKAKKVATS